MRLSRVRFEDGKMVSSALGRWHRSTYRSKGHSFVSRIRKPADPVAILELLTRNTEGRFVQTDSETTMKKIPEWFAIGEIFVVGFVVLSNLLDRSLRAILDDRRPNA